MLENQRRGISASKDLARHGQKADWNVCMMQKDIFVMAFNGQIGIIQTMYIIVGIIVAAILLFLGAFIASRLKGKMELTLSKGGYTKGENLQGEIQVTTKKEVEANRFYVALVGYEETKRHYRDSEGKRKTETKRKEVYRDEFELEGAGTVAAGTSKSYPFELQAPELDRVKVEVGDSVLEKAVGVLASALDRDVDRRHLWEVQARYDLKGVDLKAKRKVTISGF